MIVKVRVAVLPEGSRAVHVTEVTPTGKFRMTSDSGWQVTVADPELSVAKGARKVSPTPVALDAGTVIEGKFSRRGGSVSAATGVVPPVTIASVRGLVEP